MSTSKEISENILRDAEKRHAAALKELETAREQLLHAQAKHDEQRSSTSRQAVVFAREDAESAERVEARARESLEHARTAMAKMEAEERLSVYEARKAKINQVHAAIGKRIAKLVALDKQADAEIMGIAQLVAGADEEFRACEELALSLGLTGDLDRTCKRPTVPDSRLSLQQKLSKARAEEQRDNMVSSWFADDPAAGDWRLRGLEANELANMTVVTARNAEADRAKAQAQVTTIYNEMTQAAKQGAPANE
jgi:hypothetical protein